MKINKKELKYIIKLIEKECDENFVIFPDWDYRYQFLRKAERELEQNTYMNERRLIMDDFSVSLS